VLFTAFSSSTCAAKIAALKALSPFTSAFPAAAFAFLKFHVQIEMGSFVILSLWSCCAKLGFLLEQFYIKKICVSS